MNHSAHTYRKKSIVVILAVILIICVGIVWFLVKRNTNSTTTPPSSVKIIKPNVKPKNMFSMGKTQKCTYKDADGFTETYYMSSDVVRVDYVSTSIQKTIHLLADGEYVYIWKNMDKKGVSIPQVDTAAINTAMRTDGIAGFSVKKKRAMQCTPWKIDASILAAPYTVVFTHIKK